MQCLVIGYHSAARPYSLPPLMFRLNTSPGCPRVPQGAPGCPTGLQGTLGSYLALPVGRQVVHVGDVHQLDQVAGQRRPDVTLGDERCEWKVLPEWPE